MATPRFTAEEALALAQRAFFEDAVAATALPSYDDQNWKITTASGRCIVLKIAASGADCRDCAGPSETLAGIEFEHEAMMRVASQGVICPEPLPVQLTTRTQAEGEDLVAVATSTVLRVRRANGGDGINFVRAITFLPGEHLSAHLESYALKDGGSDASQVLAGAASRTLEKVGAACALAGAALANWEPGVAGRRTLVWDLASAPSSAAHLDLVPQEPVAEGGGASSEGGGNRELAARWIRRFARALALPGSDMGSPSEDSDDISLVDLPAQVIHGDLNDCNILVADDSISTTTMTEGIGVLDFGDAVRCAFLFTLGTAPRPHPQTQSLFFALLQVWTKRIYDLAIALAYACQPFGADGEATLAAAIATVRGYRMAQLHLQSLPSCEPTCDGGSSSSSKAPPRILPLTPDEAAALPLCVAGRLCQSVLTSAASVAADPSNAEYLSVSAKPGWRLLRTWDALHASGRLKALVDAATGTAYGA